MVDSDIVAVQNAFLLPLSHFMVVPAITPSSHVTMLYLGLGLGLHGPGADCCDLILHSDGRCDLLLPQVRNRDTG